MVAGIRCAPVPAHTEPPVPASEKLPLRTRVAVIFAIAAVLWFVIIAVWPALIAAPDAVFHLISKFVSHRGE